MSVEKKLFPLQLTLQEIVHLRDLMSVGFPSENDHGETVSQSLAMAEERQIVEFNFWKKVLKVCTEAGVPVGDSAPDFVVQIKAPPQLRVFEVSPEPIDADGLATLMQQAMEQVAEEDAEEAAEGKDVFGKKEDDGDDQEEDEKE